MNLREESNSLLDLHNEHLVLIFTILNLYINISYDLNIRSFKRINIAGYKLWMYPRYSNKYLISKCTIQQIGLS